MCVCVCMPATVSDVRMKCSGLDSPDPLEKSEWCWDRRCQPANHQDLTLGVVRRSTGKWSSAQGMWRQHNREMGLLRGDTLAPSSSWHRLVPVHDYWVGSSFALTWIISRGKRPMCLSFHMCFWRMGKKYDLHVNKRNFRKIFRNVKSEQNAMFKLNIVLITGKT